MNLKLFFLRCFYGKNRSSPYSKGSTKGYEGGGEESDEEESDDNDGLWHSVRKNNIQVFHFPYLDQAMANADKGVIEAYIDRRSPFLKYFSLVLGFLLILGTGIELRRGGLRRLALDRGHRRRAAAAYARALSHTEEEEEAAAAAAGARLDGIRFKQRRLFPC